MIVESFRIGDHLDYGYAADQSMDNFIPELDIFVQHFDKGVGW